MDSCCGEVEKVDAGLITRRPGSLPATATKFGSLIYRNDTRLSIEMNGFDSRTGRHLDKKFHLVV